MLLLLLSLLLLLERASALNCGKFESNMGATFDLTEMIR